MMINRGEKITKKYDVVIIGSGLSGMTCANVLGKNGLNVLLLEAHNKLGGLATWFFRNQKKAIFDVSLHGFPAGMIKTCRKYWSKEIASLVIQLKNIRLINPQFDLSTDYTKTHFKKLLTDNFGQTEKTVDDFFTYIESLNFYDHLEMTNRELFEKFFPGRNDIVRLLMEPITYANGSTLDDPALTYGIVFSNFMGSGVYTFKGGTDYLVKLMREELLKNNVDIKMATKVSKIMTEKKGDFFQAVGVETLEGEMVSCKAVVSNASLHHTLFTLLGEDKLSESFSKKAKAVRSNSSSCQVYFAVKEGMKLPPIGDLIFMSYRCFAFFSYYVTHFFCLLPRDKTL
jgi:phytoene dehydrogenase-like protein